MLDAGTRKYILWGVLDSWMDILFTHVRLPGEILLEVMKLLDRPSLLALSATCSKLNL